MKSIQAWLLRWLGAVSEAEFSALRAADRQTLRDEYRAVLSDLKAEQEFAITELIQELNTVRNSIPAIPTQDIKPPIRRLPNWSNFRAAVEQQQKPIRIERTS